MYRFIPVSHMSTAKNLVDQYLRDAGFGPRQLPKDEPQQPVQQPVGEENPIAKYLREAGFGPKPAN